MKYKISSLRKQRNGIICSAYLFIIIGYEISLLLSSLMFRRFCVMCMGKRLLTLTQNKSMYIHGCKEISH